MGDDSAMAESRSAVRPDHAVLAPESHVQAALPGWGGAMGVVLIAPAMGARFSQYLALMEPGGEAGAPRPGIERFAYVLEGTVQLEDERLGPGGYAFVPADAPHALSALEQARLLVIEKAHVPLEGALSPQVVVGREAEAAPSPLLGDPDLLVRELLPGRPSLDLAVNTMSYAPGAALSQVEVHVMEHGLLMLEGSLVYRLGESWYQVHAGDAIWMGPFCPQWCCAYGRGPARYLIYKDWNRDPLA
jgi:(S)-ureidoglycine aminohydrolase